MSATSSAPELEAALEPCCKPLAKNFDLMRLADQLEERKAELKAARPA